MDWPTSLPDWVSLITQTVEVCWALTDHITFLPWLKRADCQALGCGVQTTESLYYFLLIPPSFTGFWSFLGGVDRMKYNNSCCRSFRVLTFLAPVTLRLFPWRRVMGEKRWWLVIHFLYPLVTFVSEYFYPECLKRKCS